MDEQNAQSDNTLLHFPNQRPNEHVVLMLRRHWTVLAASVTKLVALLLLPPVVLSLILFLTSFTIDPTGPLYIIIVLGLSLYYLFTVLSYFQDFIDYHLDIWIVTDQRIISIEQQGLFKRTSSELNIIKVQDVTSDVTGKVQTFLDYGNVHIQTAGQEERFVFEEVTHPEEVAKVVLQVHDRAVKLQEMQKVRESERYRNQIEGQEHEMPSQVQGPAHPQPPQHQNGNTNAGQ